MKSPIKIVLLSPGFAADEADTAAIPALQLYARFLKDHDSAINLHIVSFQYPRKPGSYTWHGIPVYSAGGSGRKWSRIFTWIKVMAHLRRLHKKEGIDIVHSFWLTEATLIGYLFCRFTGIKFLTTTMGQDVKPENRYLRILRNFSLKLTLISQFQSDFIRPNKKLQLLKVIPFGVDKSYFHDIQEKRTIDVLGVGSLNDVKNYPEFIYVIRIVASKFPETRCRIIGEGIKRAEIEKCIKEKGLEDNIHLVGSLSYKMTVKEMQRAKVLLHTSTFEGQALVITEALAAGLYVVSRPVGMAAGLKSEKLMTGNSAQELASHIIEIMEKPVKDFKPEIPFTIDETCKDYHDIYLGLLN